LFILLLALLMPLQSLGGGTIALCAPSGPSHNGVAHDHAHLAQAEAGQAHHHHAASGPRGDADLHADADPGTGGDIQAELDGCCHPGATLPSQHTLARHPAPGQSLDEVRKLPAFSHMTGGPFRPPRPSLA
jgi:hypothetical protein